VFGLDGVEDVLEFVGDEGVDVVGGDPQVGLGEGHLDVGDEVAEEVPLFVHLVEHGVQAGFAQGLQPRSHAEPAGHDLPGLGPAEDPRDGAQSVERDARAGAAGGPRAQVQVGELVDRRGGEEVRRQVGVLDELAVGGVGGVADDVHRGVPAGECLDGLAGCGVQGGGLQGGRDGEFEVLAGQ
jgi:hypothetical protein